MWCDVAWGDISSRLPARCSRPFLQAIPACPSTSICSSRSSGPSGLLLFLWALTDFLFSLLYIIRERRCVPYSLTNMSLITVTQQRSVASPTIAARNFHSLSETVFIYRRKIFVQCTDRLNNHHQATQCFKF